MEKPEKNLEVTDQLPESKSPDSSPSKKRFSRLVNAKTTNICIGVLGRPGSGKSTYATALATKLQRELPCYVLAHDPGWRLPEVHPVTGRSFGLARHDSSYACVQALSTNPSGIHCVPTEDAGEVVELAIQVAESSYSEYENQKGIPCIVLIDELVSAQDANRYRLGDNLRKLLALRRHYNVGLIWTVQSPNLAHYQLMTLSTELVIFKMNNERDINELRRAGFSEKELATIKRLDNFQYIEKKL